MEDLADSEHLKTQEVHPFFCDSLEVIVGDVVGQVGAENAALVLEFGNYEKIFRETEPRTVLDIGANIGTHTVFFSKWIKSVYSFEPNPLIYPILQRNIEKNHVAGKAFPFGLSDHSAHGDLHVPLGGNTGNASFFEQNAKGKSRTVPTTLEVGDEWCQRENIQDIDFIKIDTEGYEIRVILGLGQTIVKSQPLVCLEWVMESTRKDFMAHKGRLHEIFDGYTVFAIGNPWNKPCYPGIKRIERWWVKNVLRLKRPPICLQPFDFASSCELVYLVPKRFSGVTELFSFKPEGYRPKAGNFSALFPN